jgi:glycosyltransferase involved in cell wall biosynthesis
MKKRTGAVLALIDSKHKWGGVASWNEAVAAGLTARGIPTTIFARSGGSNYARYHSKGLNVIPIAFGPDFNPFAILRFVFYFKRMNITHVVTNVQKEMTTAAVAAKWLGLVNIRRIGLVEDIRDRKKDKQHLLRYADHAIVPAQMMKTGLENKYSWIPKTLIKVIYTGKPLFDRSAHLRLQLLHKLQLPEEAVLLGYIGQFSSIKRVATLINDLAAFLKQRDNVFLLLYGDGKEMPAVQAAIAENRLTDKVLLRGYVSNLAEPLALIDIGLLYSESEGLPNTLVEYISAGVVPIATDVGGNAEIIDHGKNGFLFDSKAEMLAALQQCIDQKQLLKKLSEAAREKFRQRFTSKQMLDKIIDLLN